MGKEIGTSEFTPGDFLRFSRRLEEETALLSRYLASGRVLSGAERGGFELEAWLVDAAARPAPCNEVFLERLANPLVVQELARFNVELNGVPQELGGSGLRRLGEELAGTWAECGRVAATLGARLAMVGIWPAAREEDLVLENMSDQHRYRALNDQLTRLRGGAPTEIDIDGYDPLHMHHDGVMLESMATSFQIHLETSPARVVADFNAAVAASGPLVAAAANSPYLFGHDLWCETRVPLFEQAVDVSAGGGPKRVTFGHGYLDRSVHELFERNRRDFPVMLPVIADGPVEAFNHVCLHNGTIWRWNRPLVGFGEDGRPQLRIEHRTLPAGPSMIDCICNAALFFGLVQALSEAGRELVNRLPFSVARANFYAAARLGLDAELGWFDGRSGPAVELFTAYLLPAARRGLERLEVDRGDRMDYLEVIEARVRGRRTGSDWQRAWVAVHGRDMQGLAEAYLAEQARGRPVHEWGLG
ncbi:MAG: glutamate-cysteine ligase family protein [Gammaproteobacteria bacterium]|nr:glutamate-cysteine ligase family protein [Gammaproteobacteria bacterium]